MSDKDADIEALKVNKIPPPAKAHDQASRVFLPTFLPPMPATSEADISEAYGGSGVKSETPIDTAAVREAIIETLKTVYDPEIPVNIYELGLIYGVKVEPDGEVEIEMTLTAPACPVAGMLVKEIKPDLVVLDVMLPDINGKEVCQRVRSDSTLESVRIICISGMVEQDKIADLKDAGANDFLAKPFDVYKLMERSCDLLEMERAASNA